MTDPRFSDRRVNDPVVRRDAGSTGMWGWIAGVAVLALIAFVLIAGWNNSGPTTASNTSPPATTSSAPSTTGSGATSPRPAAPAPSAPAPANNAR